MKHVETLPFCSMLRRVDHLGSRHPTDRGSAGENGRQGAFFRGSSPGLAAILQRMTLPKLRRRASSFVPSSALIVVMIGVSACSRERPTFGVPRVQDAGDPGDDTQDVDAGKHQSTDGEAGDATTDSSNGGDSSATAEDVPDSGHNGDTTSSSETDGTKTNDTETHEATDGDRDADAGADPNATSEDGGDECPSGRYAANDGECQAWTECAPGSYVSSPGSATSDQECSACEEATFSDVSNAADCTSWDHCGWFETSKAGTDTSNVECLEADRFDQFGTTGADTIGAMATHPSGRVVVAGSAGGALYTGAKGPTFVRVYDSDGAVEWTRQFGDAAQDRVADVTFEPGGDIMIAGSTNVVTGVDDPIPDAFVARLASSNGEEVWREQFGTGDADHAVAIATDTYGTSVVVGNTRGDLSQNNLGWTDVMVRQYGATKEEHWTRQFGTDGSDYTTGVAIGPRGHIAIVGYTIGDLAGESAGREDGFLRVYTSDGTSHETTQFGGDQMDYAEAVAFTPSGDIVVTGYTGGCLECMEGFLRLYRLQDDGRISLTWMKSFGGRGTMPLALSAAPSGRIVVAGYTIAGSIGTDVQGPTDAFVQLYDTDGTWFGGRQFGSDGGDEAWAVALVGPEEQLVVAGNTRGDLSGTNEGDDDAFVGIVEMTPQMSQ